MATNLIGFGAARASGNPSLISAITTAGLTTNLKLALDAGDINSYPGSGQSWLDTSGGGYDFFRGATSSATTDDPTFNGVAGAKSSAEYWTMDGGDFFRYDTTLETWMSALHKDSAIMSFLCAVYIPNFAATGYLVGTSGVFGTGIAIRVFSSEIFGILVTNAGTNALNKFTDTSLSTDAWHIIGGSIDEAGGAVSFFYADGNYSQVGSSNTFDAAYSSPSSGAASYTMEICAAGNGSNKIPSGARLGEIAIWQGTALTKANFDTLYTALKGRYGLV